MWGEASKGKSGPESNRQKLKEKEKRGEGEKSCRQWLTLRMSWRWVRKKRKSKRERETSNGFWRLNEHRQERVSICAPSLPDHKIHAEGQSACTYTHTHTHLCTHTHTELLMQCGSSRPYVLFPVLSNSERRTRCLPLFNQNHIKHLSLSVHISSLDTPPHPRSLPPSPSSASLTLFFF